ncbi:ubiquitin-protein ligase 2 [Actinidia rufa]|uniref:HECT-type E3 ubiquitin transferase n=1 Tax=Actinidia rufa TaxID=165716 RepID=A0A7J0H8P4_9ERIC|nr:ubiquitin-protein ligase 2 [Actinidia rufa]
MHMLDGRGILRNLVAIAPTHCHLLITELANSVQKLTKSAMDELCIFGEAEKALLAATSSDSCFNFEKLLFLCLAAASDVEDATTSASQQKSSGGKNPGLLEKSFSLMLKVSRFNDFDNKRAHFRSKIKHPHVHHHSPLRISVRRTYILEDLCNQIHMRSTQDLKGRLTVRYQGEEGINAGGLTREWYQLLSRVIFDKGALIFTTVEKALFDGQLLDVHFTQSFYKHILEVDDMRANAEDSGYSTASPVIQWFWEVVQSFSEEDKARLLQFSLACMCMILRGNLQLVVDKLNPEIILSGQLRT